MTVKFDLFWVCWEVYFGFSKETTMQYAIDALFENGKIKEDEDILESYDSIVYAMEEIGLDPITQHVEALKKANIL